MGKTSGPSGWPIWGAAFSPSTAEMTEIAGVITPSPKENRRGRPPESALGQGHQGDRAALALVVRTHQDGDVLHRHDQGQGPKNKRDDAENGELGRSYRASVSQSFTKRIKRAGADIPENHAHGAQGERREASLSPASARGLRHRNRFGQCGSPTGPGPGRGGRYTRSAWRSMRETV